MFLVSMKPERSWETCLRDNGYREVRPLSHRIAPFADYMSGKPAMRVTGQDHFGLRLASSHPRVHKCRDRETLYRVRG
jgi:hypothetical protein